MDVAYINPFIAATRDVFGTMVKMPFSVGKPRLREASERLHKLYQVSVVIGLSGAVSGVLVLNLPEAVALSIAESLTEKTAKELNTDCMDALAEIANMIAGGAKNVCPKGRLTSLFRHCCGRPMSSIRPACSFLLFHSMPQRADF